MVYVAYNKLNKIQYFNNHMYDPRFSPAYQIPFQPLYETTRLEIERSIFTLEEKFRRRKEIDLELSATPLVPISQLEYEQDYYDRLRHIEQDERLRISMQQEAKYQHKIAAQTEHLKRIEALRKQRDLLHLQNSYKRELQGAPLSKAYNYDDNADDDELIKRYENGSKAKEYYKDLQLKNQRKHVQDETYERQILREQHERKEVQDQMRLQKQQKRLMDQRSNRQSEQKTNHHKSNGIVSERKDIDRRKDLYDTPYDILKPNPTKAKKEDFKRSPLVQELEKQFNKIEQQKDLHLSSKFAYTMKQNSSSPLKKLQDSNKANQKTASPYKGMNKYQSMGKFGPYRSKSALSPLKKSYNDSYLQAKRTRQVEQPKPSMKDIQINALKKIQNRLRVSKVIYEDSQFRNIKYEGNHLYNTFQIESRQRRQIKDKVNSHPYVLKRHALVVD